MKIDTAMEIIQKSVVLGTAHILRKVLTVGVLFLDWCAETTGYGLPRPLAVVRSRFFPIEWCFGNKIIIMIIMSTMDD